jgi:hypothetical protein
VPTGLKLLEIVLESYQEDIKEGVIREVASGKVLKRFCPASKNKAA